MIKYTTILLFLFISTLLPAQYLGDVSVYYNCNESSGNLLDQVGSIDGTNTGVSQGTSGKINTAYYYGGSAYTSMSDVSTLRMYATPHTFTFWLYISGYPPSGRWEIISGESGCAHIVIKNDGYLYYGSSLVTDANHSTSQVPTGEWVFIAVSRDYPATSNNVKYYFNGSLDNTVSFSTNITDGAASNRIGANHSPNYYLVGTMDEIGYWRDTLSLQTIDSIYNEGDGCSHPFEDCWGTPEPRGDKHYINGQRAISFLPMTTDTMIHYITNYSNPGGSSQTDYYEMYDGVCPSGYNRIQDYDCGQNDFSDWEYIKLKDTTDYSTIIHIYPGLGDPYEDGTYTHPYDSWTDFTIEENKAYVQKCGTYYSSASEITIGSGVDSVFIGSYGEGARPIIKCTGNDVFDVSGTRAVFNGVHLTGPNCTGTYYQCIFLHGSHSSDYTFVYNCELDTAYYGVLCYSWQCRFVDNIIHDIWEDGITAEQVDYIEFTDNHVYDINKWYGSSKSGALGDCLFVGTYFSQIWVHGNILDKSEDGNKACIQINHNLGGGDPTPDRVIIEFNDCSGPIYDYGSNGGASINLSKGGASTIRYNILRGYEGDKGSCSGLYLANGSVADTVYGNLIYNFDQGIRTNGYTGTIYDHNTISDCDTAIWETGGIWTNNLFSVDGGEIFQINNTPDSESYNMFTTSVETGWDYSYQGDADFENPGTDYHLQSSSDAIDQAINTDYWEYDLDTNAQNGINWDIGCYEYQ